MLKRVLVWSPSGTVTIHLNADVGIATTQFALLWLRSVYPIYKVAFIKVN